MSDTLIVIGPASDPIKKGDLAALGFGQKAAEMSDGTFDVLVLGMASEKAAAGLAPFGARKIYPLKHGDLEEYTAEAFATAVYSFLKDHNYRLVGAATSSSTREYFPRIAAKLDAPMASDILSVNGLEGEKAVFTRAVFVGNMLATVELSAPMALATCRASEFDVPEPRPDVSPVEAVIISESLLHERKKYVSLSHEKSERPELTEAEIVVTAGRGTRGPDEGIPLVEELSDVLGAALGSTRAVVDAGWLPNEFQVGQTGKIVAPKLYIAVGLSGAIQHLAGMRNSKNIVAINKDPDAPIFEVADYGLVADLFETVPQLIQAIKANKGC